MKIQDVKIESVKPYEKNAKLHPKEQIEKLSKEISEVGFTQPIVVDRNNVIVSGHGRLLAAKKLGLEKVPVYKLTDEISEDRIASMRIFDNKIADTDWNDKLLNEEISRLAELDSFAPSLIGYDDDELFKILDDDYRHFQFRFNNNLDYKPRVIKDLDRVFKALLRFYISSGADSIAVAQGGDFIGGEGSANAEILRLRRKCMNSFFCSTERRFSFVGRVNEDVNTYTRLASTGLLLFTTNQLTLEQGQTQANAGGMSGDVS